MIKIYLLFPEILFSRKIYKIAFFLLNLILGYGDSEKENHRREEPASKFS